jgi:tagatose 1,6-diphosphate aldolase GatY/KbaY
MLMQGTEELREAKAAGHALAAFSVYNLETTQAVVAAAERTGLPVLIGAGSSAFAHAGREPLARTALEAAAASSVPVGVHLDHCRDLDEIDACLELGYSSVMFDGSKLPFTENVEHTRAAAERAHAAGAWVEGELGGVPGDEDTSEAAAAATAMTDPEEAARFVDETGVDVLAVAVGNVHGLAAGVTRIDLDRLTAIADACPVPLVLHGASGVDRDVLRAAAAAGVVKFNVNTELRRAFFDALERDLPADRDGYALARLLGAARADVANVAAEIAALLAGRTVAEGAH